MRAIPFLIAAAALAQDNTPERLIEAGHWKQARGIVDRRLRETPDDPNLFFLSSQIRSAFGDRHTPVTPAEKAVSLAPGVARYHRQLAEVQGLVAQQAGVFQQLMLARRFRKELDTAIALDPLDVQALRDLVEYYLLAPGIVGGDLKKADAAARSIAVVDPAEGFLAQARVAAYRKDYAQAEGLTRRAVAIDPANYKLQIALAQALLTPLRRDESAAERTARQALALNPGRIEAYVILATIYAGRMEWDALNDILERGSTNVPDDATPYYRAAERLLDLRTDMARAEQYLQRYLSQEPEGNQPTAADANRQLDVARNARPGGTSNNRGNL